MGTAGAVEKLQVDVDRLAVATHADGHLGRHLVEVERLVPLGARRPGGKAAGQRRYVALRVDPGGRYLGHLLQVSRQHTVRDEEDVGAERGALVPGTNLGDHPGRTHWSDTRHVPDGQHNIV